jgi:hypothetical protein
MNRVVGAALLGAILGGVVLAVVAAVGPDPTVTIPISQANGGARAETISLASIVSKIAVILGVCTGALVGSLAGTAASREALGGSAIAASRPSRP